MSIIWPKNIPDSTAGTSNKITLNTNTGSTSDTDFYVDVTQTGASTWITTWPSTTAGTNTWGSGTITVAPFIFDIPTVQFDDKSGEQIEIFVLPDMVCGKCYRALGMFCSKEHYIKTDNEEHRFVHSLKCNEKLGLKYRIQRLNGQNNVYHIKCPEVEE